MIPSRGVGAIAVGVGAVGEVLGAGALSFPSATSTGHSAGAPEASCAVSVSVGVSTTIEGIAIPMDGVVTVIAGVVTVTVGISIVGSETELAPAEIAMVVCVTGPLSPGLESRIDTFVFDGRY